MRNYILITPALLGAVLSFSLAGCAPSQESVEFKSGEMTHVMTSGKSADRVNFPLPLYPAAEPTGTIAAQANDDDSSRFMMLKSAEQVDPIFEFYDKKLTEAGWKVTKTNTLPTMKQLDASKDGLEANVMISRIDDSTNISLSVSKAPVGTPEVTDKNYVPDKFNPPTD